MKARVSVDTARHTGRVDPLIYGQFLSRRRWVTEHSLHAPGHPDADPLGIRKEVREQVRRLRPSVVRWPGGCTGTSYWWEAGIGAVEARPRTVDWHFGYDVSNGFGTVEFVDFCRSVGAEPQINLNTATATLRDALNWVEYANGNGNSEYAVLRAQHGRPEPLDVRYWQIGNEEWGDWEIGHCSAAENATRAREWGKAIKRLDDQLKVLAVGCWRPDKAVEWNHTVLHEAWQYMDYLAVHTYWPFSGELGLAEYDRIVAAGHVEEQSIRSLAGLIDLVARDNRSAHRPQLAFTEWNCADADRRAMSSQWRPTSTQFRLMDALAVASFLNAMQRQCQVVGLANFAQTINLVGALFVDEDHVVPETVYWPLVMQREYSGPIVLDARVECDGYLLDSYPHVGAVPFLDVTATHDDQEGTTWVSMVNRSRVDEVVVEVDIVGGPASSEGDLIQLGADDPLAKNTPEAPDLVSPASRTIETGGEFAVALPPHSYTIVRV